MNERPVSAIARVLRALVRGAEAVSATAFAVMFALFLVGIFARYVLARPLAWTDELIMVIFLWLVFLTEALVIEDREQVTFDAVYDVMGERSRRILQMVGAIVIACLFIAALPTVLDYVRFLWRERTDVMLWRLDIVYFCFVIYWCSVIVRAAARLVRLAGPSWRAQVAPPRAALASEASGQRGNSLEVRAPDTRPEPGSSARAERTSILG